MNQIALTIKSLVDDGKHVTRKNSSGVIEIINTTSGRLVAAVKDLFTEPKLRLITLVNGETLWIDDTIPETLVSHLGRGIVPYHPWLVDIICEKIASGGLITKICKEPGMPSYPVLCQWRRKYPDIDMQLEEARKARAEFRADEVMELIDEVDEDNVDTIRVKAELGRWGAGVDDGRFSPKAKIEANISAPTQIIVQTGIDRSPRQPETLEKEVNKSLPEK